MKSLKNLYLGTNLLSGAIPSNLGKLSSLEYLGLRSNKLTGNIPKSVGQLLNLQYLLIGDNMLEGVLTETHFANLTKLKFLAASGNHLTLNVSSNWSPPFKLEGLRLGSWNLGGVGTHIPSWLETQKKNIKDVDLSNTGISGIVPSWFWEIPYLFLSGNQLHGNIPDIRNLSSLEYLNLGSNKLTGNLPESVGQLSNLKYLSIEDNMLEGIVTETHFAHLSNLIELSASRNNLTLKLINPNWIPPFKLTSLQLSDTMTNETNGLRVLHLGGNHLSGELPQDCLMKWPSLTMLNLGNNNLSGTIPNSIGFLANLRSLNLYGNNFSGHIPLSMRNCTELLKIDLANNNLDGAIPTWIGASLSNLRFLILRSNKFTAFIESASVTTKGSKLHYDTILRLVTNIDLSNNNLSGDIPKEITSLLELRSLNLSGNHLIGLIPDSIGNMKQLESLDFSRNSLSGEIPSSFTIMSSLSYLNLSCNNLTGKIPESTQLLSFNESSFIGNNLCGPPLTSSCGNDGKSHGPRHKLADQDEEDDKSEIEWFYVFLSLGYAVGLSAFFTTWILKKSWRDAYNESLENMWDKVYVYFYIKLTRLTRSLGRN
ncbi:hypothetical protein DH2020_020891 [Rehmannia glutinosa]|uniref:Uncharacterized protein n=1 Tax=Rehmannia glutinosa TaxID=99300 RepID=A0ABR0WBA9_REHGL